MSEQVISQEKDGALHARVSLHPFGPLGRLRSIGATLLLAIPGFLLNHLNWIGQFFGVK